MTPSSKAVGRIAKKADLAAAITQAEEATALATPQSWDELQEGQLVEVGGNQGPLTFRFRVERKFENNVLLRVDEAPQDGKRWNFTMLERSLVAHIGPMRLRLVGRGGDYIRLRRPEGQDHG